MRIRFAGAAGTVTGSRHVVEAADGAFLVDCGLFQGYKQLRLRNWAPFPVEPGKLESVVLTHAHLDHSGYIPALVRDGFRGRIYCTEGTFELCKVLLKDSAYLQEEQAEEANRGGWSKHHPALPLYTRADVDRALGYFTPVAFHELFRPAKGVRGRFSVAGHILGAACAQLEGGGRKLVFTGDLGRLSDAIMPPPEPIEEADVLVMESTYGDRSHDASDSAAMIGRVVTRAAARGGSVIVPSFAVGRAQGLLLMFHRLRASGAIPRTLPIYLDSPMAAEVTRLYLRLQDGLRLTDADRHAIATVARVAVTPEDSQKLDQSEWPKVIIAGSGMAAGGRVLHHLKRYGPDPRSVILFTGFQAGGTRGDAMVRGAAEVKIHGAYVPIRAKVHNFDNLSAHADRGELITWLRNFRRPPARTFLVHGEPAAADALRIRIGDELGWEAEVPEHLSVAELDAPERAAERAESPSLS